MIALLAMLMGWNDLGAPLLLATAWFYPAALILTLFAPAELVGRTYLWLALVALALVPWSVGLAAWASLTAAAKFLVAQAPLAEKRNIILGIWSLMTLSWSLFSFQGAVWAGALSGVVVFGQGATLVWVASRLRGEKQGFESS